jgi:aspartyl-tRNA(Asn)/glutamyl-tRNA(Gln) amidotransferase subunit B
MQDYYVHIGLEVHVELATRTKLFCGCSTSFGQPPNSQTCPVCLGLPGVLPSINRRAVEYAVVTALSLGAAVNHRCRFARKNYYYPDLPKNYQISQYSQPIAFGGEISFTLGETTRHIGIERVHLEEDAGKLIHGESGPDALWSFVDYNRTGVPLIEIVSKPDMHSPEEAYEYLVHLRQLLRYLRVSDCNMEEGSLRCDANISISSSETELGVKTELKNMNSFKELREGLKAEIVRQSSLLDEGGQVTQETRLWDSKQRHTTTMRGKEEAHDYRYFPEPDLPPLSLEEEWIKQLESSLPELPKHKYRRFLEQYQLPPYDVGVLTASREIADYFEQCTALFAKPKVVSNFIMTNLMHIAQDEAIATTKASPQQVAGLLSYIDKGVLSTKMGKEVLGKMLQTGKTVREIVEEQGLEQISDEESISTAAREVISENRKAVEDWHNGKPQALTFLIGQLMRKTRGKANPQMARELLESQLEQGKQ